MSDEERAYHEAMETADQMLKTINDQVQHVADRLGNGAVMAYPNEYRNPELFELHTRLTARADEIINRMQAIHRAFTSQPPTDEPGK